MHCLENLNSKYNMKFLLPSRVPQFDFQFQLLASQDYWTNFKKSPLTIEYADSCVNFEQAYAHGKWNDYCPVGSVEFCNKHGIKTMPRNIPPQLKDYAYNAVQTTFDSLKDNVDYHVKSTTQIKDPRNGVYTKAELFRAFEDGAFQAVKYLQEGFISEWRVFVLDGHIIDMQNYAGDIWTLPSKKKIEHMIYDFEHATSANVPPSYTLDVGVVIDSCSIKTTHVIEVHDFYACGTYNLNDHYHYPIMLWEWWNWHRRNVKC